MRRWRNIALLVLALGAALSAQAGPTQRVLLLNSYHNGLEWTDQVVAATRDVLQADSSGVELYLEYMDTKRFGFSPEYEHQLVALYRQKYQGRHLNLVLCSDNNAFDFLRRHHRELFPEVPVVFSGVNFFQPQQLQGHPEFTGVGEHIEAAATLRLMLKLHPHTRRVYVLNDASGTGQAWRATIEAQLAETPLPPEVAVEFLPDLRMGELLRRLRALPSDSLVLLGVYFRDHDQVFYSPRDSARLFSSASPVPVYGLLDLYLGHGIAGGLLIRGYDQGEAAALLGRNILAGVSPAQLPVITNAGNRAVFDAAVLRSFGVAPAALPPASVFINQDALLWQTHAQVLVALVGAVSLGLLLWLGGFSRRLSRQVSAQRLALARESAERSRSEQRMRLLTDKVPALLAQVDAQLRYVFANQRYHDWLGLDPAAMLGQRVDTVAGIELYPHLQPYVEQALAGRAVEFELEIPPGEQSCRYLHFSLIPQFEKGGVAGFFLLGSDVSHRHEIERALWESHERYRNLFLGNKAVALLIDPVDGHIRDANHAAAKFYGYPIKRLKAMSITDLNTLSVESIKAEMDLARIEHRSHFRFQHRLASGEVREVEVHSGPVHIGGRELLFSIIHDVTDRTRAERALQESERRFREFVDQVQLVAVSLDLQGRVTFCNQHLLRLTGWEETAVLGLDWFETFIPEPLREDVRQVFATLLQYGVAAIPPHHENPILCRDGQKRLVSWDSVLLRDGHGAVVGVSSAGLDITQSRAAEQTILRQASYDSLTHLPNRLLFQDRLERALLNAERDRTLVGLLFIDLDRFKEVNDTLGHRCGDELLVQAARRINACVRASDTVARLGGDEFSVVLPELHQPHDAESVAQAIIASLAQTFELSGGQGFVSGSIGITLYPQDAHDADSLVQHADTAMYKAKAGGRNTYQFFTPEMNREARRRAHLEQDLRRALELGQFHLEYQPIIHLETGRLAGAEALLRWHHPQRGAVPPDQFIGLAEETGLILPLGAKVSTQAALNSPPFRQRYLHNARNSI